MSFDAENHVIYRIANAPLLAYPFPHFYVESVFPEDFYRELRARLPEAAAYTRLDETGSVTKGAYQERSVCSLLDLEEQEATRDAGSFWADLNSWLMSERFAHLVAGKFRDGIVARYGPEAELNMHMDCRLVRDLTRYAISPHTDTPTKLVSLLFYLPPDERLAHLGTSIYAPKDPNMRFKPTSHLSFDAFKKVTTMPFRPNSLFGFLRTDRSFHGVDQINEEGVVRDLLLYNIFVPKGAASAKAPAGGETAAQERETEPTASVGGSGLWPWRRRK
ncbi:MAG TPA: hypothetical protein VLD36_21920 [Burkholderiales bacterium]|nr:hypothetical protein [Burkholderiales bacterium]